jgi:hypothetical protein
MKICDACGTENDDTRVFCLNCGQRLVAPNSGVMSRGAATTSSAGASAPPLPVTPQKKKAPANKLRQRSSGGRGVFINLVLLLLLAGIGFGIYLILQPPEGIPAPVATDHEATERMLAFFQKAATSPGGVWSVDERSINQFLSANVRMSPVVGAFGLHADFVRCFVTLREGEFDFVMQQKINDYPLYFALRVAPLEGGSSLGVRIAGATLGRLPVPDFLARVLLPLWQPCFDSLGKSIPLLSTGRSVSITPKKVVIRWPGKGDSVR